MLEMILGDPLLKDVCHPDAMLCEIVDQLNPAGRFTFPEVWKRPSSKQDSCTKAPKDPRFSYESKREICENLWREYPEYKQTMQGVQLQPQMLDEDQMPQGKPESLTLNAPTLKLSSSSSQMKDSLESQSRSSFPDTRITVVHPILIKLRQLLSPHGYSFLMSLLNFDASKRPTARSAKDHPYFSSVSFA